MGRDCYENQRRASGVPGCHSGGARGRQVEAAYRSHLRVRPWRFNELRRDLEGISQKVLTDNLRQMEGDGLVFRRDYGENPPRVEYGLTDLGRQMMPVIDSLAEFGAYYKTVVE